MLYRWLVEDYSAHYIAKTIKQLQNNKSHGIDDIQGEAYNALKNQLRKPITTIVNQFKNGQELPGIWKTGIITHIYNNKGGAKDCNNYRPICLAKIIYKIRPSLITKTSFHTTPDYK